MPRFTVTKHAKFYAVEGYCTVAGKLASEHYYRGFRTKREAEADAARRETIEDEAEAWHASELAYAEAEKRSQQAAKAARLAAAPVQLELFA